MLRAGRGQVLRMVRLDMLSFCRWGWYSEIVAWVPELYPEGE